MTPRWRRPHDGDGLTRSGAGDDPAMPTGGGRAVAARHSRSNLRMPLAVVEELLATLRTIGGPTKIRDSDDLTAADDGRERPMGERGHPALPSPSSTPRAARLSPPCTVRHLRRRREEERKRQGRQRRWADEAFSWAIEGYFRNFSLCGLEYLYQVVSDFKEPIGGILQWEMSSLEKVLS
ncbi:hypothetical protein OsI_08538 [Oryza sativa Indica Group]|uniref:Uncharacterized protein n=1 Tax=Oryza sativa subsp. indica TaxID=39946 RepID=B8AGS9_ORYSI|nr:hypothetical protein OsI_08538 [Oryza sativa Indica Group]